MNEPNQLTVVEPAATTQLATALGVRPKELMTYAIEVADTLSAVLEDRGMVQKFGQNKHVKAPGWQLAGSLIGFVSDEGEVKELPDGSFEATMHLRSVSSGKHIASGSARCGVDEPNWRGKPKYARRSMAFTRANGRVYSQNFRWLIELAGFNGTPAEELPDYKPTEPIYDASDDEKRWLKDQLVSRSVPQEKWKLISERLRGHGHSELDKIINAV